MTSYALSMASKSTKMYFFFCLDKATQQHADIFLAQTTEEVEQAIKKGLPAERPVRPGCNIHILYAILTLFVLSVATENRDSCK